MSRIRGKHTTPEKVVRSLLRRLGFPPPPPRPHSGFWNNPKLQTLNSNLQNRASVTPDVILTKQRIAIFVHGCFWHRHRGCKNCTTPTHRRNWWLKKLEGNAARDKLHQRALRKLGWRPIVIWECQTEKPKKLERLSRKLSKLIG